MKITFILPFAGLAGGIRVVAIYAERLQKRGHQVTVVSLPHRPVPLRRKLKSLLKGDGWPSGRIGPSHFDGLDVEHRILERYRPVTNDDVPDADVVIATWWETAEWVNDFLPAKGAQYYFVQHHEVHNKMMPTERVRATYSLPLRKITISNWLIEILAKEYGDKDVFLVPNSVDYEFFTASSRGRQARPTVGFMYSTSYYKGCDLTIAALNAVREIIPELKILTFGSSLPSEKFPLPPNTEYHFQPSQEKIRQIYSSCDFWLFCSRVEGFGLPLLEAMACCTPLIAARAGVAPELLAQGGGVLLDECSAQAMAAAILKSFELSEKDWRDMSAIARDTATRYSWDDATDLFEQAISGV